MKKQQGKLFMAMMMVVALFLTNMHLPAFAAEQTKQPTVSKKALQQAIDRTGDYVLANKLDEWSAIALKQAGKKIPADYLKTVSKAVKDQKGNFSKITDTERYILGILAAGGDPKKIGGYNLVQKVYIGDLTKQGLNGVAYGLISLDSADYQIPKKANWTRKKLIDFLLEKQNKDGGWAWDSSPTSDVDTTAMVLTALAPYKSQANVKGKIKAAEQFLTAQFQASKINNSSSAAQTVIALSALGADANGTSFTNKDGSLLHYLISFQNKDGGFDWQGGEKSDAFSTSQAFQALVAYQLSTDKKDSIYHLRTPAKTKELKNSKSQHSNSTMAIAGLLIIVLVFFYFYRTRRKA